MASGAKTGYGSSFLYGSASPASTALGEVLSIGGPDIEGGIIDVTNMASPAFASGAGAKEKLASIVDAGKVNVEVNMLKAEVTALYALIGKNGEFWQVLWSQASKWDFSGILVKLSPMAETTKQITLKLTIEISGVPTFTA
jgi:hypothetical protein